MASDTTSHSSIEQLITVGGVGDTYTDRDDAWTSYTVTATHPSTRAYAMCADGSTRISVTRTVTLSRASSAQPGSVSVQGSCTMSDGALIYDLP